MKKQHTKSPKSVKSMKFLWINDILKAKKGVKSMQPEEINYILKLGKADKKYEVLNIDIIFINATIT